MNFNPGIYVAFDMTRIENSIFIFLVTLFILKYNYSKKKGKNIYTHIFNYIKYLSSIFDTHIHYLVYNYVQFLNLSNKRTYVKIVHKS